jgi:hypothetical protein
MKLDNDKLKIFTKFVETLIEHGGDAGGVYNCIPKDVESVSKEFLSSFNIENVEIKCNEYGRVIITKLE